VLILASGNVVHNLRAVDFAQPDAGFDWAHRFDESAKELMTQEPERALALRGHTDFRNAVPTPDHFIPLLYLAGLAGAANTSADVMIEGYSAGSLSMTAYTVDFGEFLADGGGKAAPAVPRGAPPQDMNI